MPDDVVLVTPRFAGLVRVAAMFTPGSFAFVMATGIVSIAAASVGLGGIARVLFAINLVAFPGLWLLLLVRLCRRPAGLLADFADDRRGPGLLTIVAGTCVMGSQIALLTTDLALVPPLWIAAGLLWLGLIYGLFAAMTIRPEKLPLDDGLSGGWLLIVVATEALAILGTHAARAWSLADPVLLISVGLFLIGSFFYLILLTLILYRWLFMPFAHQHFTPSYWINMGAAAISTLAGAKLLQAIAADPVLAPVRDVLFTETLLLWALATWWIPLLILLTLWRHRTMPLGYRLENWSIVFPLGMYTAASWAFAQEIGLPALTMVPRVFVWVAIAAWCATFTGMVRHFWRLR
ncbi:MAG TPA: tellurite resistance/C4-dicarboxylate transporter family protein [Stellaceae bacterium]|jgi:tellurite resistance protein TehA-like permease|nr:tellurite resistance/C4-dicarboxylate transporter family protein [Stellaceae bacterium]